MNLKVVNEFGAEIVSIIVRHELSKVVFDLVNDFVDQTLLALLKVVLEEPRSHFLFSKIEDVSFKNFEFQVWIFVCKLDLMLNLLNELIK